jgi:hypothetical protein
VLWQHIDDGARTSDVFAYDVSSRATVLLGSAKVASTENWLSAQPGSGKLVAFVARSGDVYRIDRAGLYRLGTVWQDDRTELLRLGDERVRYRSAETAVVSPDDRLLAVGIEEIAAGFEGRALAIVDLDDGRTTWYPRSRGVDTLHPVAWSEAGPAVFEVPVCDCDGGDPGLYVFEFPRRGSILAEPTRGRYVAGEIAASHDGNVLLYATQADFVPCVEGGASLCSGPPFELRRLTEGGRASVLLGRSESTSFDPLVVLPDGRSVLVRRVEHASKESRLEVIDTATGALAGRPFSFGRPSGLGAEVIGVLPDGTFVALDSNGGRLYLGGRGRSELIAKRAGPSRWIIYLGWLR